MMKILYSCMYKKLNSQQKLIYNQFMEEIIKTDSEEDLMDFPETNNMCKIITQTQLLVLVVI